MRTIVVFCHLRWDFVSQRPQQLLSRLAQHYRLLFVEEPVFDHGAPFMEQSGPAPNVTLCRARTPIPAGGFHDDQIPLLQQLQASLVVYDCMDELARFKKPAKQLLQRETALLNLADLVFAGGPHRAGRSAAQGRSGQPAAPPEYH
jgi:UDP-galactopyranose mutase